MPSSRATAGIRAPSTFWRAVTAVVLLVGFYAVTLGVALVLLALPALYFIYARTFDVRLVLLMFIACVIPALMLIASMFSVRRARVRADGRRLERFEAPELFAILDDLAQRAGTAPAAEIYLETRPTLGVTEIDGKRVLVLGAPFLAYATVDELRAGLAHELGHFAFGDTRLLGLVGWTHAAFRAVLEGTERSRFADTGIAGLELGFGLARGMGEALVQAYARLFFSVTRRADRRAELAADELAGRLVGPAPASRLLEKASVMTPLFVEYVGSIIACVDRDVMPSDIVAGFHAFARTAEERGITRRLTAEMRAAKTAPYDAHPATPVRIAALQRLPAGPVVEDVRSAVGLLRFDLDEWYAKRLAFELAPSKAPQLVPWSHVPRVVMEPRCQEEARRVAELLFPSYPEARSQAAMFGAVVRGLGYGRLPAIGNADGRDVVAALFRGALLEQGATIEPSLGEPALVFRYRGARVLPQDLTHRAFENDHARHALEQWAQALNAPSYAPALAASVQPNAAC